MLAAAPSLPPTQRHTSGYMGAENTQAAARTGTSSHRQKLKQETNCIIASACAKHQTLQILAFTQDFKCFTRITYSVKDGNMKIR